MKNKKDIKIYIYVLIDPDTEQIRYIGQTNNIKKRYLYHIYEALHPEYSSSPNTHKNRWIRKLNSKNKKPIIKIIEATDYEHRNEKELYWIDHYKNLNYKLTNTINGSTETQNYKREKGLKVEKTQLFLKIKKNLLNSLRRFCCMAYNIKLDKIDKNAVTIEIPRNINLSYFKNKCPIDMPDIIPDNYFSDNDKIKITINEYFNLINDYKNPFKNISEKDFEKFDDWYYNKYLISA